MTVTRPVEPNLVVAGGGPGPGVHPEACLFLGLEQTGSNFRADPEAARHWLLDSSQRTVMLRSNPPGVSPPTGKYSLVSTAPAGAPMTWPAGQTGRRDDGTMAEDALSQTEDAFANLGVLTEACGAPPSAIACLGTYQTHGAKQGFRRGRDRVFAKWLPDGDYPVNTLPVVGGLADPRAVVEIESVLALP